MSSLLQSPRRRGSQSLNKANSISTKTNTDQVTLRHETGDTEENVVGHKTNNGIHASVGNARERSDYKHNPTLNIGLFGFGCVGKGLYDVLNHSQGLKASIAKICVKDKTKPRSISADYFTFNKHDVLSSTEHNLIVELIDDAEAALEIIGDSLVKGRSVVTANKKVLAENFELLYKLQLASGASLLYEAACAGSIPIIRTLEEYYDNELLSSVRGILNGSSNYILSKMEFEELSYLEALKEAQAAGFAETDPSLDVNGTDAKYKLCLLAAHAFGIIVKPGYILNLGVQNITPFDINYAAQNNCRIKLVAGICKEGDKYRAYVLPLFVSKQSPLATINYEFNGIEVEGVYSDKQFFVGKGAGSHPTGSAVLSDISAITYDYKYGYKKLGKRASYESPCRRGSQSQNGENISNTENAHKIPLLRTAMAVRRVDGASRPGCVPSIEDKTDFSNDHHFLENDFTIRLYIRSHDSGGFHKLLSGLEISSIEEEYTSQKGNYVIANVGFKSLFNLIEKPNDLFVCEV